MTASINADTSSGVIVTSDTSGSLAIQSAGTTQFTVASTGAYGQLKSGTAVASTSGTSITFSSIPSWVKRITVMFQGVSTNGTSIVQVRLGTASGLEATGYLGTASTVQGSVSTGNISTGFNIMNGNAATITFHGQMIISLISGNIYVANCVVGCSDSATTYLGGGSKSLAGVLTQLAITTVNGTDTFDAGSINILYEG